MTRRKPPYHRNSKGRPPAQVIGYTHDIDGERWAVRERRASPSGVWIETGWPCDQVPGPGRKSVGAPRIILTPALAETLRTIVGFNDAKQALAIGNSALNRMRQRVAMQHKDQRDRWWRARQDDLRRLTFEEFAMKHGVQPESVRHQHRRFFGPRPPNRLPEWDRQQVLAGVGRVLAQQATHGFTDLRLSRQGEKTGKATYGYWKESPQGRVYLFTSAGLRAAVPGLTVRRITRALALSGWLVAGRRPHIHSHPYRIRGTQVLLYPVVPQGIALEQPKKDAQDPPQ
ncbi:MAG: hypothetical protein VX939_02835 [Pseudomonadota bacterium]|uniref:hypothetical protein n=1 Tax=Alloalcanivorax xenomutans TaxID=1094342 RepID=UPI0007A74C34|nr:hypothetical protein [Alloalcanivorax xenomutans]KYZ84380.1 hypothetical protein A3Q32_09535 [Alcanivorax sp. KX64203]MCE7525825.1 hypothetical protein [Alloalcanivorax xenomutans]MEC7815181.1 hypothetical protein [Pseudomonadota bacterium]